MSFQNLANVAHLIGMKILSEDNTKKLISNLTNTPLEDIHFINSNSSNTKSFDQNRLNVVYDNKNVIQSIYYG
jgi:homoserine trans-succinylase